MLLLQTTGLFQFHYGSIKSRGAFLQMTQKGYFNSTMVRLKGNSFLQFLHRTNVFQFHYGSIKSIINIIIFKIF